MTSSSSNNSIDTTVASIVTSLKEESERFLRMRSCSSVYASLENEESVTHNPSHISICMVPNSIRCVNPDAYTPRLFSIGPLHHENHALKRMEKHKITRINSLFHRTIDHMTTKKNPEEMYLQCVEAMFGLVGRARASYEPIYANYEDFKFAEMMVLDGCFILELLYGFCNGITVFDNNFYMLREVKSDLLLLENQIPLFILQELFNLTIKRFMNDNTSLTTFILCFFKDMNIFSEVELPSTIDESVEHCHILGLIQSCYKPRSLNPIQRPTGSFSATKIARSGVTFKANKDEPFLLAVKFKRSSNIIVRNTSLKLPVLCIKYYSTESFMRNLIAFEQCYPLSSHHVTSFAFLMNKLIQTQEDVSLLVESEVIEHHLGTNQDVATMFNNICKGVVSRDFYYPEEWKQLDEYCDRFWSRISIWETLMVILVVMILVFTLVKTIFTVLDYYG